MVAAMSAAKRRKNFIVENDRGQLAISGHSRRQIPGLKMNGEWDVGAGLKNGETQCGDEELLLGDDTMQ
jgi:hypothetical protein